MYKLTSSGTFADPHASGAIGYILVHGSTATTGNWVYSSHGNGTDHIATYKVASFSGSLFSSNFCHACHVIHE